MGRHGRLLTLSIKACFFFLYIYRPIVQLTKETTFDNCNWRPVHAPAVGKAMQCPMQKYAPYNLCSFFIILSCFLCTYTVDQPMYIQL